MTSCSCKTSGIILCYVALLLFNYNLGKTKIRRCNEPCSHNTQYTCIFLTSVQSSSANRFLAPRTKCDLNRVTKLTIEINDKATYESRTSKGMNEADCLKYNLSNYIRNRRGGRRACYGN